MTGERVTAVLLLHEVDPTDLVDAEHALTDMGIAYSTLRAA